MCQEYCIISSLIKKVYGKQDYVQNNGPCMRNNYYQHQKQRDWIDQHGVCKNIETCNKMGQIK